MRQVTDCGIEAIIYLESCEHPGERDTDTGGVGVLRGTHINNSLC
jgi:hypothetical protein